MSQTEILRVQNLKKTFRVGFWRKRVEAVRNVTFGVRESEIFGIVGPNGAGKTTTMKIIMNLILADDGEVEIFGEPSTRTESRRRLGYLPEEPYFYDHLTVTELLHYYGSLHGMSNRDIADRTGELLELVGLDDVPKRRLREFSKGMRQRAGIAQALINDPELVILDEPQSGLDPVGRKEVRDLIFDLREEGRTVVFSSHILVDVEAVCDRVAIMNEGKLVEVADLDELGDSTEKPVELVVEGLEIEDARKLDGAAECEQRGKTLVLRLEPDATLETTLSELAARDVRILELTRSLDRLEDRFLMDTGHSEQ